jgi:hypothetical protein
MYLNRADFRVPDPHWVGSFRSKPRAVCRRFRRMGRASQRICCALASATVGRSQGDVGNPLHLLDAIEAVQLVLAGTTMIHADG